MHLMKWRRTIHQTLPLKPGGHSHSLVMLLQVPPLRHVQVLHDCPL